jgi:hypothetical protein
LAQEEENFVNFSYKVAEFLLVLVIIILIKNLTKNLIIFNQGIMLTIALFEHKISQIF